MLSCKCASQAKGVRGQGAPMGSVIQEEQGKARLATVAVVTYRRALLEAGVVALATTPHIWQTQPAPSLRPRPHFMVIQTGWF